MSQKILLYRIKADSPEFACEKAKELVIPKVDLGLLNEEEIVLAQVLTILNKLYNKYNSSPKLEHLNYLDVSEGENLEVLKQNLENIKSKTLADNLNWTLDHDWRNNKFSFMNIRGQTLDAIMRYLEKDIPNLEDIIFKYLGLPNLEKKTIKDIRDTFSFTFSFEENIFYCLFQMFDPYTGGCADEMARKLYEINCTESAEDVLCNQYLLVGGINISELEILGCLSEDNESYLCGDDDYPSSFTFEKLNKRYDNDPKYRERWNPESKSYEDKIENFNVLIDLDDDEDVDHDGHFHPLEELNYEGEKGKIYIVFGAAYDHYS